MMEEKRGERRCETRVRVEDERRRLTEPSFER
jgi:hypothetical protein